MVVRDPVLLSARGAAGFEQMIGFGIGVPRAIHLVRSGLRRMPDDVLVRVGSCPEPEDHGVEASGLDELLDESGPLDHLYIGIDPDGLEPLLDDLGDLPPLVIALVGADREGEGPPLAVLHDPVVVPVLPARFGQEGLGLLRVVLVTPDVIGIPPRAWADRARGVPRQTKPDPPDQLLLVDRMGKRLAHALVGEAWI